MVFFFPSWQPHGVDINMNTEKGEKNWSISVSFNFIQSMSFKKNKYQIIRPSYIKRTS